MGLVNNKLAEMSGRRAIDRQGRLRELAQARQELENIKAAIRAGLWMSLTREALEEAEVKVLRLERETVQPARASVATDCRASAELRAGSARVGGRRPGSREGAAAPVPGPRRAESDR